MSKKLNHQRDRLLDAAIAVQEQEAWEAGAIGFYNRVMCQISIPARPWPDNEFEHAVGKVHLSMLAPRKIGVPWGIYPRGIMSWIATDVVRRKNSGEDTRILYLGHSLAEFIKKVSGTETFSGGARGNIPRFKRQLISLFASRIFWWFGEEQPDPGDPFQSMEIASSGNLPWHPRVIDQPGLFSATIELGEKFHEDILEHAVPIDLRILTALWPNCLAVDLYTWATYRAYTMRKVGRRQLEVSWEMLRHQFGAQYGSLDSFKQKFRPALLRVKVLYQGFEYIEEGKGITFKMREPSVRRVFVVNGNRHLVYPRIPR